jgi:PAS domain S-box-containing protein
MLCVVPTPTLPDLRNEPLFRSLFQQTNDAVLVLLAENGAICDSNDRATDALGYDPNQLLGKRLAHLVSEENRAMLSNFLEDVTTSRTAGTLTSFLFRADGYSFPCELRVAPVTFKEQELLMVSFQDVTEKIKALEDIHLRNIAIANVQSGVTIADARQPDLPLIYVNRGFQTMTGYTAKDAIGRSCRFLQGHDRSQEELEVLRKALRNGDACIVQLRNYRKDGSLFFNELHISPVRNELGELTHYVGIQLDVTDKVRSREVLERSERRYRQLADAVDDLILRRTRDGIIEFASSASERLTGRSPQNLVGLRIEDLIHPEDVKAFRTHSWETAHAPGSLSHAFRWRMPHGAYRWFEARENRVEGSEEEGSARIVSVLRDVTDRVQAEEEIQRALQQEREINEMKTRFISMVSHEFRTPMTGISASSALIRRHGDKLGTQKRDQHLGNIERSLKRMNRLLDDVLFFSRAEADRLRVNAEPLNLKLHLTNLVESIENIYPDRHVVLDYKANEKTPYILDSYLLDHILHNLIGNALKYSPKDTSVTFSASESEGKLHFTVRDLGIGIPDEDQKKLFVAFHRAGNVGNRQGTGLGLNIALRAVEFLGGSIDFQSKPDHGSTFKVTLPAEVQTQTETKNGQ